MDSNPLVKYWQYIFVSGIPLLLVLDVFVKYPLPLDYYTHKLLHILGVIFFVGNIIITFIWMRLAEKAGKPEVIGFAAKTTHRMDVHMTAPGALLILINGLIMADTSYGGAFELGWIRDAVSAFVLSALVWVIFLVPIQKQLIEVTEDKFDTDKVTQLLKRWYLFGTIATVLPLSVLYLMVVKPAY